MSHKRCIRSMVCKLRTAVSFHESFLFFDRIKIGVFDSGVAELATRILIEIWNEKIRLDIQCLYMYNFFLFLYFRFLSTKIIVSILWPDTTSVAPYRCGNGTSEQDQDRMRKFGTLYGLKFKDLTCSTVKTKPWCTR